MFLDLHLLKKLILQIFLLEVLANLYLTVFDLWNEYRISYCFGNFSNCDDICLVKIYKLHGVAKGFVFFFSALLLIFTGISRFTDLTPSTFEVLLYFLYQLGITIGILLGTFRKLKPQKIGTQIISNV